MCQASLRYTKLLKMFDKRVRNIPFSKDVFFTHKQELSQYLYLNPKILFALKMKIKYLQHYVHMQA